MDIVKTHIQAVARGQLDVSANPTIMVIKQGHIVWKRLTVVAIAVAGH